LLLVLTAAIKNLRPPKCENGSNLCQNPSQLQLAVLYMGLGLASIGLAGTRYTIAPMGANQFDKPKHQGIFFNWYIATMYSATVISATAIVYVQDNVSWTLGFGISFAANVLGLAIFLAGSRIYRHLKPEGSPFVSLARVVVAAARKRKLLLSPNIEDYYQGPPDGEKKVVALPTKSLR
jgi:solute carrier family 15 (peptide/histidine transporter), member 3/4